MNKLMKEHLKDSVGLFFTMNLGICAIAGAFILTSIFWKSLGYDTIKNETRIESLEITNKDEDIESVWNGKNAILIYKYYISVQYAAEEYTIKIQRDFFEQIEIGDYVECEITKKKRKMDIKQLVSI